MHSFHVFPAVLKLKLSRRGKNKAEASVLRPLNQTSEKVWWWLSQLVRDGQTLNPEGPRSFVSLPWSTIEVWSGLEGPYITAMHIHTSRTERTVKSEETRVCVGEGGSGRGGGVIEVGDPGGWVPQ